MWVGFTPVGGAIFLSKLPREGVLHWGAFTLLQDDISQLKLSTNDWQIEADKCTILKNCKLDNGWLEQLHECRHIWPCGRIQSDSGFKHLTVIMSFTPVHIASISSFTTSSSHNSSGLHCVLVYTRWSVLY